MLRRILWSACLSIATFAAIGVAATYLQDYPGLAAFVESLAFPGALLSGLFHPQGVHSDWGGAYWGVAVVALNLLTYASFWFVVLTTAARMRSRARKR